MRLKTLRVAVVDEYLACLNPHKLVLLNDYDAIRTAMPRVGLFKPGYLRRYDLEKMEVAEGVDI